MALTSTTFGPSGSALIDGLLNGVKWNASQFTFSFPTSGAIYGANYSEAVSTSFAQLNASMQAATRFAFANISNVANVTFAEISNALSDLPSAYTASKPGTEEAGALAWAYFPSDDPSGGDAWYNTTSGKDNINGVMGANDWATVLHEIGHAMGLKHPHQGDQTWPTLASDFDYGDYTVMSYRSTAGGAVSEFSNETFGYSHTLMQLDIAALQFMYGANYSYKSGDTVYRFSATTGEILIDGASLGAPAANRIYATLWDGGGVDTYDLSAYATNLNIDLNPGAFSTFAADQLAKLRADGSTLAKGNIANALLFNNDARSLIENVIGGAGDDRFVGNKANNTINGGAGKDAFVVNAARASVTVSTSGDKTTLTSSEGVDTLINIEEVLFSDGQTLALTPGRPGLATGYHPAVALTQVITGGNPTTAQLDIRAQAAQAAYDYYANTLKVAQPGLGPYESLGVSFSALTEFQTKYGLATGDTVSFINKAYQDVFLRAPTAGQQQSFADQIAYFSGIYQTAGLSADAAALQARGAVVGQMIGYVMTSATERDAAGQQIDDRAIAYVNSLNLVGVSAQTSGDLLV